MVPMRKFSCIYVFSSGSTLKSGETVSKVRML